MNARVPLCIAQVAQFFESVLEVNMLENVLYDRKNMRYEELLEHVTSNLMLVTCCIDAHFTAFQVLQMPLSLWRSCTHAVSISTRILG